MSHRLWQLSPSCRFSGFKLKLSMFFFPMALNVQTFGCSEFWVLKHYAVQIWLFKLMAAPTFSCSKFRLFKLLLEPSCSTNSVHAVHFNLQMVIDWMHFLYDWKHIFDLLVCLPTCQRFLCGSLCIVFTRGNVWQSCTDPKPMVSNHRMIQTRDYKLVRRWKMIVQKPSQAILTRRYLADRLRIGPIQKVSNRNFQWREKNARRSCTF